MVLNFKSYNESNSYGKNLYNAWKSDPKGNPIEGTDRRFRGKSKRNVLKLLATEEGVNVLDSFPIVKLPNGDFWCVSLISKGK